MRRALLVVSLSGLAATPAAAQSMGYELTLGASTGATDNALLAPRNVPGVAGPEADIFGAVEPGFAWLVDGRRVVSSLTVGAVLRQYANETAANARTVHAAWLLAAALDPTWNLGFDLSGSFGEVGTFDPATAGSGIVPTGGGTILQVGGGLSLTKDFTARWRGLDSMHVAYSTSTSEPKTQPDNVSVDNSIGVQLTYPRDAGALTLSTNLNRFTPPTGTMLPSTLNGFVGLNLSWLHEISTFWSSLVSGGGGAAVSESGATFTPTANLALTYKVKKSSFNLSLRQSVTGSSLVGLTLLNSEALLGATTTVFDDLLALGITVTGSHGTSIGTTDTTVNSVRAEATLYWTVRDNLGVDLTYQFLDQSSSGADAMIAGDLIRNTVTLGLRTYFPQRAQAPDVFGGPLLRVRASEERDQAEAGPR